MSSEIEIEKPSPLFIQQAFLLSHEFYHYWFSVYKAIYKSAIESKYTFLYNIYKYDRQSEGLLKSDSFKDALNNKNLIEECICDSMGAISAINFGIKLKKQSESKSAVAIIEALNYQFILSCIESFNGQINSKINFSELNEFNFRLLHLKHFLLKYLREDFGDDSSDKFEASVNHSDYFINNTIQYIADLYARESLLLKDHFNAGESIDIDIRKQLLRVYSL